MINLCILELFYGMHIMFAHILSPYIATSSQMLCSFEDHGLIDGILLVRIVGNQKLLLQVC